MRRHPSCGNLDLSPRNKGITGQNRKKTATLQAKKEPRVRCTGRWRLKRKIHRRKGPKAEPSSGGSGCGLLLSPAETIGVSKKARLQDDRSNQTTQTVKGGINCVWGVRCARHRHMSLFCNPRAAQKGEFANIAARLPNSRSASRRARTREKCRARIRTED